MPLNTSTLSNIRNETELMSDPNQKQPPATQSMRKTSAVPLRKETVRVTLKAPGAKPGNLPANVTMTKENVTPSVDISKPQAKPTLPSIATPPAPSAAKVPSAPSVPAPSAAPSGPPATPLKHETMRVTLKADTTRVTTTAANPGGAPIAPSAPGAPAAPTPSTSSVAPMSPGTVSKGPSTAPIAPGAPSAPQGRPSAPIAPPAPSVPGAQGRPSAPIAPSAPGAPAAPVVPAATIPLGGAPAVQPASPAPTMNLGTASPTVPLATPPMGGSQPLPQATVQLQQTQPLTQGLGTPTQAAMIQTVAAEDEGRGIGALVPLSIIAFVLSLVVLYFQYSQAKIWVDAHQDQDVMTIFEGVE